MLTRELHDDQIALEREITALLEQPFTERRELRLNWHVSGRRGSYSAIRRDGMTEARLEVTSPTIAGLATLIQRYELGGSAQRGEITTHDASAWRTVNTALNARTRLLQAVAETVGVPQLERIADSACIPLPEVIA